MSHVVIQDAPKTHANVPAPVKVVEKPKRLTFDEAFNKVLDESKLKAIADGKDSPDNWPQAHNRDIYDATIFMRNVAEDLTRITGVPFKWDRDFDDIMKWAHFHNPNDKFKLAQHMSHQFSNSFRQYIVEALDKLSIDREVPIDPLNKGDAIAIFRVLENHAVKKITFANPSFVDPYDFPRRISRSAQKKINVLEKTHYDYQPQILDGLLVDEKTTKKLTFMTPAKAILRQVMEDPALVVAINGKSFVVDYWREPLKKNWQLFLEKIVNHRAVHIILIFALWWASVWFLQNTSNEPSLFQIVRLFATLTVFGSFIGGTIYSIWALTQRFSSNKL